MKYMQWMVKTLEGRTKEPPHVSDAMVLNLYSFFLVNGSKT
jgi:hypothetical protein